MEALNNWVILQRYEPTDKKLSKVRISEETAFTEAVGVPCVVVSAGPIPGFDGWSAAPIKPGDIVLASLIGATRHREGGSIYYAVRYDNVVAKI